ncbi:aminotransferase class V-fold PLP-dependent enzyme [Arthrobacter pigmenti]
MHIALDDWASGWADYTKWERSMEASRSLFAQIFNVSREDVGLLPAIAPAIAAAAATIGRGRGTVVAHRREFRSLLLPVLAQVDEDRIQWVEGDYSAETFIEKMDDDTAAVIASAVSSHDGGRPSLSRLKEACAAVDARLIIDGTQAAGIVIPDVPLQELTVFAASGYKGLCGPRGVAYALANNISIRDFPTPSGYGMADMGARGSYGPPLMPKPGAQGFDQSPSWLSWVGAEPALIELANEPSIERERRVLALSAQLRNNLEELHIDPQQTDLPSSIVSFDANQAEKLVTELAAGGVRAAAKQGRVRLGLHTYNDEADVQLVSDILAHKISGGRRHLS